MGIVATTDVKEKNRYSPVFRTHKSANRLTHIYDADTNLVAHYQYDPFGRRISKQVGTNTTYYLYSDEGLIAEYDEAGNEVQSYGYTPNSLWMNNPLYTRTESHTSTNKGYYYYLNDHLGAPQKLMAKNGEVVWCGVSEAFGQTTVTIETIKNNLRFSSQYYDEESGLHYNFFRYYDPSIGRYIRKDPAGIWGGINLYLFAYNSSLAASDRKGLWGSFNNAPPPSVSAPSCNGQIYDSSSSCCCKGHVVSRRPVDSGFNTFSWSGTPDEHGTPMHIGLAWDGGSVDANSSVVLTGMQPGDGIVHSPAGGYPFANKPPQSVKLSPCEYDLREFDKCIKKKSEALNGTYGGLCYNFLDDLIKECQKKSRGCTSR